VNPKPVSIAEEVAAAGIERPPLSDSHLQPARRTKTWAENREVRANVIALADVFDSEGVDQRVAAR